MCYKMERGAEAASSGEQVELELETSTASGDQSLPCAEDGSHKREEGKQANQL